MRLVVHGIVQGVGFRPAVHRIATSMDVNGWVQNNGGNVVIELDRDHEEFLDRLMSSLPPLSQVERVEVLDSDAAVGNGFRIIPSTSGERGAGIPVDTAICPECLTEMGDPSDRRAGYPFTSCTDCGARFTLISELPYDRVNTAFSRFEPCPRCKDEYSSSGDRRFHHQTVCCPECGPRYRLVVDDVETSDSAIEQFAGMLEDGAIGVAKSWGGMHICCTLENIPKMRRWYGREQKPFAVMVRDLDAVRRYSHPDDDEVEALCSPQRPIVLVPKKDGEYSEYASPGLDNIGLFLPYTGMQHLLFQHLKADALVMTSANVPGEPMILDDDNVRSMGADAYLLHDQDILNRADDSVIRMFDGGRSFIRRSRGHTPAWLPAPGPGTVVALGGQENIAGTLAHKGRMYCTQYIGDADHIGVLEYLDSSIEHLRRLLGADEVSHLALDMHPGYSNRRLARVMAERFGAQTMEIQHHWAHAASLLVDAGVDEAAVLTLDGSGYGDDGTAWGGEVLLSTLDDYRRVGHLRPIPLLGGEKAVYDIRRLCFAIDRLADRENDMFEPQDSRVLDVMMSKSVTSSSMGRIMDALSCYLGVCDRRSYDGEPAMKLETLLNKGKRSMGYKAESRGLVVDSVSLISEIIDSPLSKQDKAYTIISCLIDAMVEQAADAIQSCGSNCIGVTGGVSYNNAVCSMVKEKVESMGLEFIRHRQVPNGDGGLSVGQAAIALRRSV